MASDTSLTTQFVRDWQALCRLVAGLIGEGLERGEPGVLIVTPRHATEIAELLRARSHDVDTLKRLGDLVFMDARETIPLFVIDGVPNTAAFTHVIWQVLAQVQRDKSSSVVRVYTDMADLL